MSELDESAREQHETAFTRILRRVLNADQAVLCVAYVDREGETVDYCTRLDPFDAKVAAAELDLLLSRLQTVVRALGGGAIYSLCVYAEHRELVVRRVTEDYSLALVVEARKLSQGLDDAVALAAYAVRRESGIEVPAWDPQAQPIAVASRVSQGWGSAPAAFVDGSGVARRVEVLGRSVEEQLCLYRVRTEGGEELTLVHDGVAEHWLLL